MIKKRENYTKSEQLDIMTIISLTKVFAYQSIPKSYKDVLLLPSSNYLVQQNSRDQENLNNSQSVQHVKTDSVLELDLIKINNKSYWEGKSIN